MLSRVEYLPLILLVVLGFVQTTDDLYTLLGQGAHYMAIPEAASFELNSSITVTQKLRIDGLGRGASIRGAGQPLFVLQALSTPQVELKLELVNLNISVCVH